jgi:hypothetical protein
MTTASSAIGTTMKSRTSGRSMGEDLTRYEVRSAARATR